MIEQVTQYSSIPAFRISQMAELSRQFVHIDGAFVECGVYNGGGAAVMARELGPRPVWLFDSFEGLPKPEEIDGGRATMKYNHKVEAKVKWQAGDPVKVQAAFRALNRWDSDVHIVKGWFEDTLPGTDTGPIAALHLDADWYASTCIALETLYDRVVPGGLILVDDYGAWVGCRTAVQEFWQRRHIAPAFTMLDETAGYWVKDGKMHLRGSMDGILDQLARQYSDIPAVLTRSNAAISVRKTKREIAPYQAAVLYAITRQFDYPGSSILEIGTALGFSASVMAQAAPRAHITTLNPRVDEADRARLNLATFPNVKVVAVASWDYLKHYKLPLFDIVFVDGDHAQVRRDMPWFDLIRPGGLMIFHDYSPAGTYRACPPVFDCLNEFAAHLGRDFDVLVVDDGGVGLAGWYKREGESWS
ncbi:MAG: TylF/MycF/NovP-related O-methyltransferase [Dehalococcoidia bacterium]